MTLVRIGLIVTLSTAVASSSAAQGATPDSAALSWARRLLQAMHAEQSLIRGIESGMNQRSASASQLPAGFFDSLAARARRRAPEIIDSLVPVYARSISLPDLKGLVQFYESAIGQRYAAAEGEINLQATQVAQRWGARLGLELVKEMIDRGTLPGN